VDDPIFVTDKNWNVIYLNKAAKHECNRAYNEQFSGLIFDLFDFFSEEVGNIISGIVQLSDTEVFKRELNLKPSEGVVQPYDLSVQAFLNDEGNKLGYSFLIRNLSVMQKQEALAKRAKMVVENSPAVLFTIDPNDDFKILYISENIRQFGYNAQDLIGQKGILELLHPDDVEELMDFHLKEEDEKGIPAYSGEYRIRKITGEYRWVEDKSREILDQDGRVVLHEGIIQDITERKKTREEIIKSQDRYRVLAANIPYISVFLIDKDLRYIVAQGSTLKDWGMEPSDFEGKTLAQIHRGNLSEIEPAVNEALFNKKAVNKILVFRRRYYEMTVKPILHGGEVEYALGILRDINKEHKAKENLQKSEEKYRRLVEESTEIIFSLDTDFSLTYISPNVKQFLGYEPEEVVNHKLKDFLHESDIFELAEMAKNPLQFLEQNQYLEFKLRRKDGLFRIFSSNGKIVSGEDGQMAYNGIARDITLLKEAQRELFLAKEKAEQASMVKSQFLSIMSHEIRTPMNAVIGMAHLLIEDNPRPDQLENLKTLQFSAENLLGLINDILDFTKIDSGKVELEHVDFELKNVINRIIHSYTYQAREKALEIIFDYDNEIPNRLFGDPVRLGQIINNLVSNAVKFTQRGYVKIVLKRIDEDSEDIAVKFHFEDTGIGIPEDKTDTIFEAFTQASAETTRKFGGTGLGLAIVKKLVALFGGEIQVKPRKEGGTQFTFVIRFQKVKVFTDVHFQKIEAYEKDLHSAKILVAEDNLVNQVMINKFLMKWGVKEVVIAANGKEAIREFDSNEFHLVLLDLQMPEMDGFEVATYVRAHHDKGKRKIPIIALTASSLIDVKQQLEEVGVDDFIPKPFNPDNLYAKIIKYLNI
jgi:PAS domain S-box-containing protein